MSAPTAISLFAGVGGFDLALERAGYRVTSAVEIDAQARGVLARRFPNTRLFADVQEVSPDELVSAGFISDRGVIAAGFPCQDLSSAGKRAGLAGQRSGLFWEILRLADELRPEWLLLENVPGLLTSHGGRDFEVVLEALVERGYGVAWRILDAQHFGVPQRRRRVFIVARRSGDLTGPESVLLERESGLGDPPAILEAWAEPAERPGGGSPGGSGLSADRGIVTALSASLGGAGPDAAHAQAGWLIPDAPAAYSSTGRGWWNEDDAASSTLTAHEEKEPHRIVVEPVTVLGERTHALTAEGHDASEDGTGRGTPILAFVKKKRAKTEDDHESWASDAPAPCLNQIDNGSEGRATVLAVDTFVQQPAPGGAVVARETEIAPTLDATAEAEKTDRGVRVLSTGGVRRLTPRECERLQGFPDDWTAQRIQQDGRKVGEVVDQADSSRYRQMGNAVAVPVVEWILRRLIACP